MKNRLMKMEFVPGAIQFGNAVSPALTLQKRSKQPTDEEKTVIEKECKQCVLPMKKLVKNDQCKQM